METGQINVPLLGDFDLYTGYLHFLFSILFKLNNFQLFPEKIFKIVFPVTKLESGTEIQEIPAKMEKLYKNHTENGIILNICS